MYGKPILLWKKKFQINFFRFSKLQILGFPLPDEKMLMSGEKRVAELINHLPPLLITYL